MGIGFSENGAAFGKKRIGIESKSAIFCKNNGFIKIGEKNCFAENMGVLSEAVFCFVYFKNFQQ